jgi:simple sugar transport system ATP-binding protein
MSVAENLYLNRLKRFCRFGMLNQAALRAAARRRMGLFDVRGAGPDASLSTLSGGNQQKVVLARELGLPNLGLLVAAQPTRGLDVGAVEAIYLHIKKAADAGAGVLLISSELDELLNVADRIVVMYRGRIMGECPARVSQRARIGAMMAGHDA